MARLTPWLAVVAWAAAISAFSTDTFSSDHTSRIILPILHALLPHGSASTIDALHHLIRKCAHVFEYFIFGVLLYRAVRAPRKGWRVQWAATALFLAALFASFDEFHQSFVPSRGPSIWDVLLDTAAAAAAQLVCWLWARRNASKISGNSAPASY